MSYIITDDADRNTAIEKAKRKIYERIDGKEGNKNGFRKTGLKSENIPYISNYL